MDAVNPVLAHKVGLTAPAPNAQEAVAPATPMRQMRRALGRAADSALGLSASVIGLAEDDLDAEAMIDSGPDDWIVLGLRDGDHPGLTGLFLIEPLLRSAVMEMLTMGNLLPLVETHRPVTRTDAVMAMPFADQLLKELSEVGFGGDGLDPAGYDMGPIDDLRTAGLVMAQGTYRCWRITVQLGGGDNQGEMMIALRPAVDAPAKDTASGAEWGARLRGALEDAPTELDAIIARLTLPIAKIEGFEVGDVLHLAGTTVGSVTLHSAGGVAVATARLGQVAGKRAVRIEVDTIELEDAPLQTDAASVNAAVLPNADVADYADPDGDMQNDQPDFASADLELEAQPAFIPPDLSDT